MKNEWIIDEKTQTLRLEPAGRRFSGSRWQYLRELVDHGEDIPTQLLAEWFKRCKIRTTDFPATLSQDQHAILKASFGILQVGFVVTNGHQIAVFQRPKKEKPTGVPKLLSGFSLLRTWSPLSTEPQHIQAVFEEKTGFKRGRRLEIEPLGVGYVERTTKTPYPELGPGYLFVVHKALCSEEDFRPGEHGKTKLKSGGRLVGFFDPGPLYRREAVFKDKQIEFESGFDNVLLDVLANGSSFSRSGHLAAFNTQCRITGDPVIFSSPPDHGWIQTLVFPFVTAFLELVRREGIEAAAHWLLKQILPGNAIP